MPVYEFRCKSCGFLEEVILSMNEYKNYLENNRCNCGGELEDSLNKNIVFKGGSFYTMPPKATRKLGDEKKTMYKRPKWV